MMMKKGGHTTKPRGVRRKKECVYDKGGGVMQPTWVGSGEDMETYERTGYGGRWKDDLCIQEGAEEFGGGLFLLFLLLQG